MGEKFPLDTLGGEGAGLPFVLFFASTRNQVQLALRTSLSVAMGQLALLRDSVIQQQSEKGKINAPRAHTHEFNYMLCVGGRAGSLRACKCACYSKYLIHSAITICNRPLD